MRKQAAELFYPGFSTLVAALRWWAEKAPGRLAVSCDGRKSVPRTARPRLGHGRGAQEPDIDVCRHRIAGSADKGTPLRRSAKNIGRKPCEH
jgi:hypothetical protein